MHNHDEEEIEIQADYVRQRLLRKTEKDPTSLMKNIYDEVLEKNQGIVPEYKSVKSSLYRARKKKVPDLPTTVQGVHIRGK